MTSVARLSSPLLQTYSRWKKANVGTARGGPGAILRAFKFAKPKVCNVVQGEVVVWLKHPVPEPGRGRGRGGGGGGGGGAGGGSGGGQKMTKSERIKAAVKRVNGNRDENEKNKGSIVVDECQLTKNGEDGTPNVFAVNRMVGQLFEVSTLKLKY